MPPVPHSPFQVAAVQAAPVFMDRQASVAKACELIAAAAARGARLAVFPEAFVPGYPDWVWSVPAGKRAVHNAMYAELLAASVRVPDESTRALGDAARRAGIHVAIGVNERGGAGGGSLFNTIVFFGPDGAPLGVHRKLVATGGERLVWAQGDASTLSVFDTPVGRIGALTCWENYMPLARFAMYAQGVQVYLAPTWDRGEPWGSTLRHIAREGGVYVVGCGMALRRADIPDRFEWRAGYPESAEWINAGDSAIVHPSGALLAGPAHQVEDILLAEVDLRETLGFKSRFDPTGHYGRPDLFTVTVRRGSPAALEWDFGTDPA